MDTSFLFQNCYTGTDFENLMVRFLGEHGFRAKKTGSNDGGIDIIATSITRPIKYSFNIQCKFFNKPLSKAPIQEVYAGTHYYNNGAAPVVITNNRVTAEARIFAKKLGVEIIADAEWTEIKQVIDSKKIANPNVHGGLMGILLAFITSDSGYLKMVSSAMLLSSGNTHKRGISNDQTCILTCKDRSGYFLIDPVCVGRLETSDLTKTLAGKFASDAIMVTDSHAAYPAFAESEKIQLEQIESGKHSKGAYNLGRINAEHAKLAAFYPRQEERNPATKYLGLQLKLFWWLEVNGGLSTQEKVDTLYDMITAKSELTGTDYESIANRELTLNTKGCFPNKV